VHKPAVVSGSEQEALVAQMLALLTERINLEIVAMPTSGEEFKVHIYLFGVERPIFSFSLGCVATNPTISACLYKICSSGYEAGGEKFFAERSVSPDRTRVTYRQFGDYNEIFDAHFFRMTMFLHYVQVFISCIDIHLADQFPKTEIYCRANVLLDRVIRDVESRLAQRLHTSGKAMSWIHPQTPRVLQQLRETEKTPQNVKKLFSATLVEHIRSKESVNAR